METEPNSNPQPRELAAGTTSGPIQRNKTQSQSTNKTRLTKEEESNLADYLSIGMSIEDAREAFDTEVKAAELRLRVRENQRAQQRGSIQQANRTQLGPSTSNRGTGRGGLSFN